MRQLKTRCSVQVKSDKTEIRFQRLEVTAFAGHSPAYPVHVPESDPVMSLYGPS